MIFTKSQYKILALYFSDISKGLFLGMFAGQILPSSLPIEMRINILIFELLASLLFLYFSLICSYE